MEKTENPDESKIVVIGSIGNDEKITLDEIPEIGKTKTVNIDYGLGGKGNIEAVACARTDGDTTFIGACGERDYENYIKHFENEHIKPILKKVTNVPSHTACILIDKEGKHRIVVDPRAGNSLDKNFIKKNIEIINKSSFILLQLEINFQTVEYVIENFKNEKNIILRPSPISHLDKLRKMIKNISYLISNEVELSQISGEEIKTKEQIETACDKVMKLYKPKNIIVPLFNDGWLLWNEKGKKNFNSYDVGPIVDKVGSMDCFIGVFASFLSRDYDVDDSIKYAILAYNICCTRVGTIPSLPIGNNLMNLSNKISNW